MIAAIAISEKVELRNLAGSDIPYVHSNEFDAVSEEDFADGDVDLYANDGTAIQDITARSGSESFLLAVEQSRILTGAGETFLFKRLNFLRFRANALQSTLSQQRKQKKAETEIDRLLSESNQTREKIACASLRLVTSIVRRLATSGQEFEEFLAEANTILLKAIDKFDYSKGFRFSTYLTHAVQRHTCRLIKKNQKRRQLESDSSRSEINFAQAGKFTNEANAAKVDLAVKTILDSFSSILDEREQQIVRARFGLDGGEKGKSMREIGDEIGLSKERVRQIINTSVEKLAKFAKPMESSFDSLFSSS